MPTPISIRVSEETAKRLDDLSRQTGRSKAFYLRKLIEENLDDMEDYYLAAERFTESRKKGGNKHASHDSGGKRQQEHVPHDTEAPCG